MLCPRCRRASSEPPPPCCEACGAPLRLADEPLPSRLDAPLDLDRRRGRREADAAAAVPPPLPVAPVSAGPPARADELARLSDSHWDLGRVPAAAPARAGPRELGVPAVATAAAVAGPLAEPFAPSDEPGADGAAELADVPDPEVEALEIHLRRPPSWRRALAGVVDALPFAAGAIALARGLLREAAAALPAPATGLDGLLDLVARERGIVLPVLVAALLAFAVYVTLGHALAGATLGKRLLRLRLVGPDGATPSLGRSAARSALAVVSASLLGTGFLLALFVRSGRALHDLAASTWVVEAP